MCGEWQVLFRSTLCVLCGFSIMDGWLLGKTKMAKTDSAVREAPDVFFQSHFIITVKAGNISLYLLDCYDRKNQVNSMHTGAFLRKCLIRCCFIDYLLSFLCYCYCCYKVLSLVPLLFVV